MEPTHIYCQCCKKIKPIKGSEKVLVRYTYFPETEMDSFGVAKRLYYRDWYILQCKECKENGKQKNKTTS